MSDGMFRSEVHTFRPPTREDVLTDSELADALKISVEKVHKADLPTIYFGRDKRYVWGQVLDVLTERARNAA